MNLRFLYNDYVNMCLYYNNSVEYDGKMNNPSFLNWSLNDIEKISNQVYQYKKNRTERRILEVGYYSSTLNRKFTGSQLLQMFDDYCKYMFNNHDSLFQWGTKDLNEIFIVKLVKILNIPLRILICDEMDCESIRYFSTYLDINSIYKLYKFISHDIENNEDVSSLLLDIKTDNNQVFKPIEFDDIFTTFTEKRAESPRL